MNQVLSKPIVSWTRKWRVAWESSLAGALLLAFGLSAHGQALSKPVLLNLRFEQKLNEQLPLAASFRDENGIPVRLRECLKNQPAILVLGYYACPMLCGLVLNGLVESLQEMRSTADQDFQVLFVSIDPLETPELAAAKKCACLKRYGRPGTEPGWHFLVGDAPEINQLCRAVGFQYAYDASMKQYAHPSGIVVVTPEGKVAKYLFGVSYPPAELNEAVQGAASHRIGSPVQQLLILCFQHLPLVGKNSATILRMVRGLAVLTVLGVGGYVAWAVRRERQRTLQGNRVPSEQR